MFSNWINDNQHTVKQWLALKACSDWLLKVQISFVIHLQASQAGFAPENILNLTGTNELKSSFCAILTHCFNITLYYSDFSPQCQWPVVFHHKPPSLWCLDVNYNKVKQLSFGAFLSGVFSAELPECMQEIMTEKTKDYYQHFLPISEEK